MGLIMLRKKRAQLWAGCHDAIGNIIKASDRSSPTGSIAIGDVGCDRQPEN
jgi:hypothetical protein